MLSPRLCHSQANHARGSLSKPMEIQPTQRPAKRRARRRAPAPANPGASTAAAATPAIQPSIRRSIATLSDSSAIFFVQQRRRLHHFANADPQP